LKPRIHLGFEDATFPDQAVSSKSDIYPRDKTSGQKNNNNRNSRKIRRSENGEDDPIIERADIKLETTSTLRIPCYFAQNITEGRIQLAKIKNIPSDTKNGNENDAETEINDNMNDSLDPLCQSSMIHNNNESFAVTSIIVQARRKTNTFIVGFNNGAIR